jgi:outer membrane protein OmpA-like peptidoglycan-associated protein
MKPHLHTLFFNPLPTAMIGLLVASLFNPIFSQKDNAYNLVPNPSFEEFSDPPSGWYYSGKDFSRVSMFWTSPTAASPDVYAPGVKVPVSWQNVGFGKTRAYNGDSFAGITVYGCDNGKPHCREYIQVQLSEPLVPGQRYGFSCMLSPLQRSVSIRNIGLWFSNHEIDEGAHDPILQVPVLSLDRYLPTDGKWYRWSGHFQAHEASSYLLIGNFTTDDLTQTKWPVRSDIRFGYTYIDDVRLFKIPPILEAPVYVSPLTNYIPKKGESITLSSIYFEHDRTDFMPRAVIELNSLLTFLKKYPTLRIDIIGHTDNVGTVDYNQHLSVRRAEAVVNWLKLRGIKTDRMQFSGKGDTQPVSSNWTSEGRGQNRRVEIRVVSL